MSALGQKQTSAHVRVMSALAPKADIGCPDGCFVQTAEVPCDHRNGSSVPEAEFPPSIIMRQRRLRQTQVTPSHPSFCASLPSSSGNRAMPSWSLPDVSPSCRSYSKTVTRRARPIVDGQIATKYGWGVGRCEKGALDDDANN